MGRSLHRCGGAESQSEEPRARPPLRRGPTTKSSTLRASLKVEPDQVRGAFEKFADSEEGCLKVENLTDVLGSLGLARLPLRRSWPSMSRRCQQTRCRLTCEETYAVCGLLSTPNIVDSNNKYTITARRTYLETGRLATDDAVINFLDALDAHKRQCEAEGKYMEARAAAKRISTLKMQEAVRLKKEMIARQKDEMAEAEEAFAFEKERQEASWTEKVKRYEEDLTEAVAKKKRAHMEQLEQFIAEMENKKPSMPKASKDLLIHRNIELHLAKQGQYTKATRVKDAADRMEIAEMESTLATFEAELSLKEGKLRAKQQQELDALIQKGARGRDELEIASVQDMERRVQRYRNLVAELSNLHKLEIAHLENFLEGKAIAGKCDPLKDSNFRRRAAIMPPSAMERP
eukprot:jgi/Tetstr1/456343/TSEL_043079.t1